MIRTDVPFIQYSDLLAYGTKYYWEELKIPEQIKYYAKPKNQETKYFGCEDTLVRHL